MRTAAILVTMLVGCGGIEPQPEPIPVPPSDTGQPSASEPYCGDGYCDADLGEDEWWCIDCGYDPLTGGPADGGYCGDGVCFGGETLLTCFSDCEPKPLAPGQPPWDPGYIDPVPIMRPVLEPTRGNTIPLPKENDL